VGHGGEVLTHVAVVVPVHDEEQELAGCLDAIGVAAARIPGVRVDVIVVLDRCTDGSAAIAERARVRTVATSAGNVGRARAVGVMTALRSGSAGLWIATTDADSRVPPNWLRAHLAHAADGVDVLAGTVVVTDWLSWPAEISASYERAYAARCDHRSHRHVHGANLGFRGSAYLAVGGFQHRSAHEDRELVETALHKGLKVAFTVAGPVATSARRVSRLDGGFASHLRHLAHRGASAGPDRTAAVGPDVVRVDPR